MLPPVLGADISLRLDLDPDLGRVKADPAQLEQVIMNLVFNARDAMPEGGELTIETSNCTLDDDWVRSQPGIQSGCVRETGRARHRAWYGRGDSIASLRALFYDKG